MSTRGFVGYRHKGVVKGWYNHCDSYPRELGKNLLEKTFNLSQEQLRNFFLKRILWVGENDPQIISRTDLWNQNWGKKTGKLRLVDAGEFYKDGVFCEYSYIFDLDAETPTLLLFTGFGRKPSKGYETWFEPGTHPKDAKTYMVAHQPLVFKDYPSLDLIYGWMFAIMEDKGTKDFRILKEVISLNDTDLPVLVGAVSKMKEGEVADLTRTILETRLKG